MWYSNYEGFVILEQFKIDIDDKIRQCYGALSSFQAQLHHINGIMEEIHSLCEEMACDIKDMDNELKKIKEVKKNE